MNVDDATTKTGDQATKARAKQQLKKRRRRWGCCLVGCAAPLSMIVLLLVIYYTWQWRTSAEIESYVAEIRERGEPLTFAELDAYYRGAGDEVDKSDLFITLLPKLPEPDWGSEEGVDRMVGLSQSIPEAWDSPWPEQEEVRAFLSEHRGVIDETEAAAVARGVVRQLHDYNGFFGPTQSQLERLRSGGDFLQLRAELAARDDDWRTAFRSIHAMFELSKVYQYDPAERSQSLRNMHRTDARDAIARMLPAAEWNDKQLETLIQDCLSPDWPAAARRVLIGERVLGIETFSDPSIQGGYIPEVASISTIEDKRFYLEIMAKLFRIHELPLRKVQARQTALFERLDSDSLAERLRHPLTPHLVFFLRSPLARFADHETTDRATAAHLAIKRFQLQNTYPPTTLAELVPDFLEQVPLDPFDNQPLRYRLTADEAVIYSVSFNRKDDGVVSDMGTPEPDLVIVVKRSDEP